MIKYFIRYSFDGINLPLENGGHLGVVGEYSNFVPATKEQRDILMKVMADAGYTFDFKKKELKEIESDEWSDECCINQLIVFCENCMVQDTNAKRCANFLKSLKDRVQPKKEWKPSEGQLKALKEAVDKHFDIDGGALWHLYEELKKLTE